MYSLPDVDELVGIAGGLGIHLQHSAAPSASDSVRTQSIDYTGLDYYGHQRDGSTPRRKMLALRVAYAYQHSVDRNQVIGVGVA